MPVEPQPAPESELKPQAQELNRQVGEQTPEQRMAEAEAIGRSVREAAAQAAQAIELPKAECRAVGCGSGSASSRGCGKSPGIGGTTGGFASGYGHGGDSPRAAAD